MFCASSVSLGHGIAGMFAPFQQGQLQDLSRTYIVFKIQNIIRFRIDYYEISTLISWAIYSKDKLCDKKHLNDHDNQPCDFVRMNLVVIVTC